MRTCPAIFYSIPHAELMKSVARRVSDRHLLRPIKTWLEAPVEEIDDRGRHHRTTRNKDEGRGTPQGSPLSPLLAEHWDLCTGQLKRLLIEPGRHSDAKSAAVEETPPAGSLSLWDLGSFCLKRFRQWAAAGAFWIARWQPVTAVLDPDGQPLDLPQRLRQHTWDGPLDIAVLLGSQEHVPCRRIALRAPREVAARRRQKAYEKAQKSGRTPSREHLEWCDWTIFVTHCTADQLTLTWKEVVVLYRSRGQIELLFKLWKSHNRLATHAEAKSAAWPMAECWAKLIGVVVQHWLLLTTTWLNHRRSLMQAAAVLRDGIAVPMEAIGDRDRLSDALSRLQITITAVARVNIRRKKPSWFQLLLNPELLEYSYEVGSHGVCTAEPYRSDGSDHQSGPMRSPSRWIRFQVLPPRNGLLPPWPTADSVMVVLL